MRLFINSLSIESGGDVPIPDLPTYVPALTAGVEVTDTLDTFYYWTTYLTSDFPMLTGITKKYFWVWSSDHGAGTCWWGQGDNLDLSDFTESGRVISTNDSNETPFLIPIDGKCMFYYHAGVPQPQQTDLYQGVGSLTDIDLNPTDWTFYDNPLGLETGGTNEDHTGYLLVRKREVGEPGMTYEGNHLARQGTDGFWRRSESMDGINWTRLYPDIREDILFGYPASDLNCGYPKYFGKYIDGAWYNINGINTASNAGGSQEGTNAIFFTTWGESSRDCRTAGQLTGFQLNTLDKLWAGGYLDRETMIYHSYLRTADKKHLYYGTMDWSNITIWVKDYTIQDEYGY